MAEARVRKTCPKCGYSRVALLESDTTCPICKTDYGPTPSSTINSQQSTDTRSNKVIGVVAGISASWITAATLILVGILLSATVIGLVVGVPLIIVGLLTPFFGPLIGFGAIKGPCPYCGTLLGAHRMNAGVTCRGCKKRLVIRDKKFILVE